jgi:hypothetical protein
LLFLLTQQTLEFVFSSFLFYRSKKYPNLPHLCIPGKQKKEETRNRNNDKKADPAKIEREYHFPRPKGLIHCEEDAELEEDAESELG